MSQRAIREYDAKKLRARYADVEYFGLLINEKLLFTPDLLDRNKKYVIKPDQLFGKRGQYGLVGVNLEPQEIGQWIEKYQQKSMAIKGVEGVLDTFLIELFVPHQEEYYIAIKTERNVDIIYFSEVGGVDIEENWDNVKTTNIGVLEKDEEIRKIIDVLVSSEGEERRDKKKKKPSLCYKKTLIDFILKFYAFFKAYGFSYLEVNPFVINPSLHDDEHPEITCLDMVAKIDDCECWKQKKVWENITWGKPFGARLHPLEKMIEQLDAETGASLKFSTLNPNGRIGLILGGGGASVVTMDKLADMGLLDEVINYGELSGNPNYRHNKVYIQGLLDLMCTQDPHRIEGSSERRESTIKKKRLCLIGGIANFTNIEVLARAFIDALKERVDDLKLNNIHLLVRRGGVRDVVGIRLIQDFCEIYDIPHILADGDVYITDAIEKIQL